MPNYQLATAYYDSSVIYLDAAFSDYEIIFSKNKSLTKLVSYLNIVELEDSLQIVAKMSEEDILALIDEIIKNVRQKEIEDQALENQRRQDQAYMSSLVNQSKQRYSQNPTSGGKWYFYNITAKNFGQIEFQTIWGKIKLEDDWRRRNKKIVSVEPEVENEITENESEEKQYKALSDKSRDFYFQNVPVTDSFLKISHQNIKDAFFNIGMIYKYELFDYKQSMIAFEELNKRYSANEYLLSSYYNLYELNNSMNNEARANYYKNLIVSEFPESKFAGILTNPDYFKELEKTKNEDNNFYIETYNKYLNNQFSDVIRNCDYAISNFENNELISKFMYLKALSIGETQNITAFKEALAEVKSTYPESEITESVENILAYLYEAYPEIKEEEEEIYAEEIYNLNEKAIHYFVIVADKNKVDINQLIFNLINFNIDNFDIDNLEANSESFAIGTSSGEFENLQIISIKDFNNKDKGLKYYKLVLQDEDVFKDFDQADYQYFIISSDNYNTLIKDTSINRYLKYFKKHYL